VDPVPDDYFSENLVAPGIEPGTFGSVASNTDHWTTEAVDNILETKNSRKAAWQRKTKK
jgi:hypothetical protein